MTDHARSDWPRYDADAFARARRAGKPLLLRITHFGCEATADMERHADPDPATQRELAGFVAVSLDRDLDPALDRACQLAHQLLTQTPGGWPLHVFFDAETALPYFSATWLPSRARDGLPAFATLLARARTFHDDERAALQGQHAALRAALEELAPHTAAAHDLDEAPLRKARATLEVGFDFEHGGFGTQPKFVRPALLERLLRDWRRSATGPQPDLQALFMVTLTLTRLAASPMRAASGAFHGHATEADWSSPDPMCRLADNGALLALYAQATLATGEREFAHVTRALATELQRNWRTADGAFIAAMRLAPPEAGNSMVERDERVFVAGNAQTIRGLAWAARALRDDDCVEAACAALAALRARYWRDDRLLRPDERMAGLEEHALLADATLELLQQRWDPSTHAFLESLVTTLREHFEDQLEGGFFDVHAASNAPSSFRKIKTFADDSAPAGNAIAARVLLRTAAFAEDPARRSAALRTLRLAAPMLLQQPQAHATLLGVLEETLWPPEVLVLKGVGHEIENARLDLQKVYTPTRLVFAIPETCA